MAVSMEMSTKLTDWLVLKNGCADLIDLSSDGFTQ